MDIEQTKRMNFMIKELTKSGIVNNFDDAVSMATGLYTNGSPESTQSSASVAVEPKESVTASEPSYDHIEKLAERKAKNAVQNYAMELNKELESLRSEIDSLKLQLRTQQAPLSNQVQEPKPEPIVEQAKPEIQETIQQEITQPQQQEIAQPQQIRQETPQPQQQKEEPHPIQGEHSPNNVDLQEFFYFGTK